PLTHADGAPLEFQDTLDPLPENAPGAVRPERPAPQVASASMEAIRAGQVQQGFSSGSPSPQTGPQWAPGAPGAPQGMAQQGTVQQGAPPGTVQQGAPMQGSPYPGPGSPQPAPSQQGLPQNYTAPQTSTSTVTGQGGTRNR